MGPKGTPSSTLNVVTYQAPVVMVGTQLGDDLGAISA